MALLRIDARGKTPVTATGGAHGDAVQRALAGVPRGAPAVIMVHGYTFCPDVTGRDPHRHILSLSPRAKAKRLVSWPAHLGFRRPDSGLAIAFGWDARGSIWRAGRATGEAAEALSRLVALIRRHRRAPVHLVAHSLGARVCLRALAHLPLGAVDRVILMSAAAFPREAQRALESPAGQMARVVNVTSGENALFDLAFSASFGGALGAGRSIGRGLDAPHPNWRDLRIDDERTRAALARIGYRIAPPVRRICHWSPYLRPGMFPLYRALIEHRLDLADLPRAPVRGPARSRNRLLPI